MKMPYDGEAISHALNHNLSITTVSWEDNARTKNSCWGPCISDMTLAVNGQCMPLVRGSSNFNDETWDVEIEKIPLVVGNEDGTMLRTVTLKEYLKNLRDYLSNPSSWKGKQDSLLSDRDQHVICSAQACFLPMPAEGDAKFNVAIRNYQSRSDAPAVLAIVASANGTSAEVLDGSSQRLYHNKQGDKASFIGQRLTQYRKETGSSQPAGAPMTSAEKQQNMLLIIQVPLKQKELSRPLYGGPMPMAYQSSLSCVPCPPMMSRSASRAVDVESAIVKIGESEGKHLEIHDLEIERDHSFPIRVTMQYYKATSNGAVNDQVMSDIAAELQSARKWAVAISSLVTETTNRTTEHNVKAPSWWALFWADHFVLFPQYKSSIEAANLVFANNRFSGAQLPEVQDQVLDILGKGEPAPAPSPAPKPVAAPALPSWDVL
jgi:hypothetical protein